MRCLPLYHSINLMREAALDTVGTRSVIAVGYLVVLTAGAWWFAVRRLRGVLIR